MKLLSRWIGILLAIGVFYLSSCKKDGNSAAELEAAPTFDTTAIGKMQQYYFDKYDVYVEYEWNRYDYSPDVLVAPVQLNDVIPFMDFMNEIFFKALDTVATQSYAKTESPVKLLLMGTVYLIVQNQQFLKLGTYNLIAYH